MKKKILAGVLAAASALSMSVSAFAAENEKAVTKPGEIEYDVPVTAPTVVLDLVMPAKLTAALNPYGAEIKLDTTDTTKVTTAGIASTAYKVTNNSEDYGVYIDATAVTTIETADKTKWTVSSKITDGTKGAALALIGADDMTKYVAACKIDATQTSGLKTAAATSDAQGMLVLDSTVEANKETGVVAGQTSQKKVFYVKAKDTAAGEIYIGFAGDLAESKTTSGVTSEVEWTEEDAINVNLVLKVTAGPKTFPTT